ncbi:MAG: ubiquitin-binding protein cue5 [Icmadophila ericetorum]|nr:ubiquitin-binding protein cue5 [Icmadophila ericetorum]
MADSEKAKPDGPPESPTTARELDFDDEPLDVPPTPQKQQTNPGTETSTSISAHEATAPPQPPRPLSPRQQAENTLKEAFPNIDAAVVRAVLTASGGQVEPAFNALLGMSDPDSQREPTPPPQPPRPQSQTQYTPQPPAAMSQMEADEMYARQLAAQYNAAPTYGGAPRSSSESRGVQEPRMPRPQKRQTGLKPNELYDDRHSFIDDDLPVIRDNIKKGFLETQKSVNSFITNLKKKIDGDDEPNQIAPPTQNQRGGYTQAFGGRRSGEYGRRSADRERYDADPQVLGDDFTGLQLRDEEAPKPRSTRPLANPDLFKPTPPAPGTGRRVSFQDGPPEEIGGDLYRASPDSTKRATLSASKGSKWQPLATVDPNPMTEHDPFSLGDSDDEEAKKKDGKVGEEQKVKKEASEAMGESVSGKSAEPGTKS